MTRYLSFEDILRQVERAGCVIVTRACWPPQSSDRRPQTTVFGDDAYPTIWVKTAALCQSIDNNQALVDGNKRLAWLATKMFFAVNGYRLKATADEGEMFMLDLVAGHAELPAVANWLEQHATSAATIELLGSE